MSAPAPGAPNPPPPVIARLTGGGSVVAWANAVGAADAGTVNAQILSSTGAPSGGVISIPTPSGSASVAVAGLREGGWVIAWDAVTVPDAGTIAQRTTVQFRRYSATGQLLQETTTVSGPVFSVRSMHAVATTDGGFAFAFAARDVVGAPDHIFAQRFGRDGARLGDVVTASNRPGEQRLPQLAALPDGSTVLVWLQAFEGNAVFMRPIDASGQPGAETQLVAASSNGATTLAVGGIADCVATDGGPRCTGSVALAFAAANTVFWQTFTPAGAAQSTLRTTTVEESAGAVRNVAVVPMPRQGFHVLVGTLIGTPRGENQGLIDYVVGNRVGAGLATILGINQITTAPVSGVSPTSGTTTGPASIGFGTSGLLLGESEGFSDEHFVYAWASGAGPGVVQINAAGR